MYELCVKHCVGAGSYKIFWTGEYCMMCMTDKFNKFNVFLISNFRHVLNVVCFLLGNSPASEFYMPTFRGTLFHLHRQVGVKPIGSGYFRAKPFPL